MIIVIIFISVCLTVSGVEDASGREWTLMFYMGGSGDLSDMVENDLDELRAVSLEDNISIIVLADQEEEGDSRLLEIAGGEFIHIPLSTVNSSWVDEVDMSDQYTLSDFVRWTKDNYASQRYFLNLWGHGNGWRGMSMEVNAQLLTLPEMRGALDGLYLDIIGFDSCTMGMFEVYYELREHSGMIIASEKEEPLAGWPYTDILTALEAEPKMTPTDFASVIVETFVDWGTNHSSVSTTLTAVDTSTLPITELEHYTTELGMALPLYHEEISQAWEETESYQPSPNPRDLYHFTMNVHHNVDSNRLRHAGVQLREAINVSVKVHRVHSLERDPAEHAHGIGIYFPSEIIYRRYDELTFAELRWATWLKHFIDPPKMISNPGFEMDIIVKEGYMEAKMSHDLSGAVIDMHIFQDGSICLRDTSRRNQATFLFFGLGDYLVEGYLIYRDGIVSHIVEEVQLNRSFVISGFIESQGDVIVKVHNQRTVSWNNFTVSPGNYSTHLSVPYFCEEGDTLHITYTMGNIQVSREVVVAGRDVVVDVTMERRALSLPLWVISTLLFAVFLVLISYIKRKRRSVISEDSRTS